MRDKQCETCIYFDTDEFPRREGMVQMGECRVNPPVMISVSEILFRAVATPHPHNEIAGEDYGSAQHGAWPVVRDWDWCGKHEEQKQ